MGSLFTAYASLSTSITLLQQAYLQFIPSPLRHRISAMCHRVLNHRSPKLFTLLVEEYHGITTNPLFKSLETYLCNKITTGEASCLKATSESIETRGPLTFHLAREEKLKEKFNGFEVKWVFHTGVPPGQRHKSTSSWNSDDREMQKNIVPEENRYLELRFLKIHKEEFFGSYLPQVLNIAANIKNKDKVLKLWTLKHNCYSFDQKAKWESVKLNHPSTFDTLALNPRLKQDIINDLDRFLESKEFYKKVGRAWKRGYLLYGPPGTGKSSLIAAIANYLKFDVYDLQLMHIQGDSMLRKMLLSTMNRSILVIEDIDCSMGLPDKRKGGGKGNGNDGEESKDDEGESDDDDEDNDNDKAGNNKDGKSNGNLSKISLSGLLNFIDGLWSSCGDERIIIFTTNHKNRIDPALLRPGRMDFHINMSYICMDAFKTLASNYLDMKYDDHKANPRLGEIEEMIRTTNVTPAEVAEELMKGKDVDIVLEGVVKFLKRKRVEVENDKIEREKAKRIKKMKKEEKAKEKALNIVEALTCNIKS